MIQPRFRRLVLGFHPKPSEQNMRFAVDLAELLRLDLFGVFVEDLGLFGLAALPFAREIGMLGGGWRPINVDSLSRDLQLEATTSERRFATAAKRLRTAWRFEVVRGVVAETLTAMSSTDDIVMIVEPASAADRATGRFTELAQAALGCPAAVLLVPQRMARQAGPILAIATTSDDPSIGAAASIAAAAGESLVVVATSAETSHDAIRESARNQGVKARVLHATTADLDSPATILDALGPVGERLVVMTRGRLPGPAPSLIVYERAVPVLVLEPPRHAEAYIGSEGAIVAPTR